MTPSRIVTWLTEKKSVAGFKYLLHELTKGLFHVLVINYMKSWSHESFLFLDPAKAVYFLT